MLKKSLPTLILAAFGLLTAQAQTAPAARPSAWCGTPEVQERYFAEHPGAREAQEDFYRQLAAMPVPQQRNSNTSATPDITIPVVVHIIHSGGPNNISNAQINSGIDLLNLDYQKLNDDTAAVAPLFRPILANVGFRFRLAKIDPNGNCTTGITRHYAPALLNDDRSGAVQGVSYWNPSRYLNIWVVDAIGQPSANGTVLGYVSGLPPNPVPGRDGFVTRGDNFGNFGTSGPGAAANRTATHEIGHYMGLSHTWGQNNNPGTGNCNGTDYVADTPRTDGTFSCNLAYAPCGVVANTQNYMDYSICKAMFTVGQRTLMRGILQSYRTQLTTPANLIATGTNDGYTPVACAPIAAFFPNKTLICEGGSITFRSCSYNLTAAGNPTSYAWTFPNGTTTPGTATTISTTATYPVAGTYPVTLTVTNNAGTDTHTETQLITVLGAALGESAPLNESFEDPNSPFTYPAPSQHNYATFYTSPTANSLTSGWRRATNSGTIAAADGNNYLVVRNLSLPVSASTTLITPNINLSGITSPVLSFSEYFGSRSASSNVSLRVSASTDCGSTWTTLTTYQTQQLNLTGTTYQGGVVPSAPSDYQQLQLPIPAAFVGTSHFQLRFVFINSSAVADNNFYFDKLQVLGLLGTQATALAQRGISIYPNPLTSETAVHLTLAARTEVQIRLTDVLGREVLTLPTKTYPAGEQAISLATASNGLPAGVYVVRITLDGQTYTSKLAVQ